MAQQLILSSDGQPVIISPFRFDREKLAQPSSFEFRFLLGDRVFIYGFDVTTAQIFGEWLAVLKDGDELTIFERDREGVARIEEQAEHFFPDDATLFKTLGLLSQLPLTDNQLLLNRIRSLPTESQGRTLNAVVRWLTQDLVILGTQYHTLETVEHLFTDREFRDFSSQFLQPFGTGIGNLEIAETKREKGLLDGVYCLYLDALKKVPASSGKDMLNRVVGPLLKTDTCVRLSDENPDQVVELQLLAVHDAKNEKFPLPFSEESDGTQQLLHFMPVLSPSESEQGLRHRRTRSQSASAPLLGIYSLFQRIASGDRKQLIVTTHEAHLLDQELLRRDEYWFVEKDAAQQSRLVSLSDFNIRNDLQIEKGYLQGRFGAIPVIGSMSELERLLEQPAAEATCR